MHANVPAVSPTEQFHYQTISFVHKIDIWQESDKKVSLPQMTKQVIILVKLINTSRPQISILTMYTAPYLPALPVVYLTICDFFEGIIIN